MPAYAKYVTVLFGLSLLLLLLHIGRGIVVPVYLASLFAWLMTPFCHWLEKRGLSRKLGAVLSLVIVLLFFALLIWFFVTQLQTASRGTDQMQERLLEFRNDVFLYAERNMGFSKTQLAEVTERINSGVREFLLGFGPLVSSLIVASVLFPMSMYFFIAHRNFYHEFLRRVSQRGNLPQIEETIRKETEIVRSYLLGIMGVVAVLAVCNVTALTLIGIEYALLFGVVAACLNVIPVIGSLVGSLLPVIYALIMKDSVWYPVIIGVYFIVIQLLESSVITPNIVGKRMGVNPYAIILAVFFGSVVWGPLGMVLFIPLTAQIKVICTVAEPLKAFGFVLSDPEQERLNLGERLRRWRQKRREG